MKIYSFFLAFALLAGLSSFSQSFTVPADVSLETKEDYVKHEKDVIAAAKWLESTPVNTEKEKRKLVSAFVLRWITGSPTVSLAFNTFAADLTEDNPELLGTFVAGYCRYALENNYSKDELKSYTAAVKSVLNLYSLGGDFNKNKTLKKALEKDKEGKLEEWIKDNMK